MIFIYAGISCHAPGITNRPENANPKLFAELKSAHLLRSSGYFNGQQSPVPIDRISPELRKCIYRTAGSYSCYLEL